MTDPVITINGRALIEAQVQALRGALKVASGEFDVRYDPDRLTEVMQMLDAPSRASGMPIDEERPKQVAILTGMHQQRVDRALQLAGIVPEQASPKARRLAEGYVLAGVMVDEAAVRLQRALKEGS